MTDKGLTAEQLGVMNNSQLSEELERAEAELFNLRSAQAVGNLEDHSRMEAVRRGIARIHTIACRREFGYRTASSTEE